MLRYGEQVQDRHLVCYPMSLAPAHDLHGQPRRTVAPQDDRVPLPEKRPRFGRDPLSRLVEDRAAAGQPSCEALEA